MIKSGSFANRFNLKFTLSFIQSLKFTAKEFYENDL